jgi:hypothetical protein
MSKEQISDALGVMTLEVKANTISEIVRFLRKPETYHNGRKLGWT